MGGMPWGVSAEPESTKYEKRKNEPNSIHVRSIQPAIPNFGGSASPTHWAVLSNGQSGSADLWPCVVSNCFRVSAKMDLRNVHDKKTNPISGQPASNASNHCFLRPLLLKPAGWSGRSRRDSAKAGTLAPGKKLFA
jgi:hypothetical protein